MSLEAAIKYSGFILALIGFSYAFNQRGKIFVIPEGIYIGAFSAHSFIQIYRSLRATSFDFIAAGQVLLIIPVIVGILAFTRLTRFRWLARYPVALLSGAGVGTLWGLSLRGQLLGPISDTVTAVISPTFDAFSKLIFVVLLIPIITMFLYSRTFSNITHERTGRLYYLQRFGRLAFMVIVGYQLQPYGMTAPIKYLQTVVKPVIDDIIRLFAR